MQLALLDRGGDGAHVVYLVCVVVGMEILT